jgi:phage terminase small subunit
MAKAKAKPGPAERKKPRGRSPGQEDHTLEKRDEFRAHYLLSGVASQSARAVGIAERTGQEWAAELVKEPAFAAERADQRARVLPEFEARLLRAADKVLERVESPDLAPKELAAIAVEHGLKSFSYQNPKPQYFKGLVDTYKAIGANRKTDELGAGTGGPAVVINLTAAPEPDAATG